MANGGARPGAGRKSNAQKLLDRQNALAQIAGWFPPEFQKSVWTELLNDVDATVRLNAAKYLSDQMYGRAPQSVDMNLSGSLDLTLSERLQRAREASPISE